MLAALSGTHAPGAQRDRAQVRRAVRMRAVGVRSGVQAARPRRRSASTSPPANATTRPAPTRSRAAPRSSCASLRGSYSGVMGLPLYETAQLLERMGAQREPPRRRMTEEILVNVTPQETRVAVLAAGQVQELLIERGASRGLVGNIYVGKVARVLPGIQSAFVEIGLERAAFLHVADMLENGAPGANGEHANRQADREDARRGPAAARAGGQGPDRQQGRAALDPAFGRRPPAGVPAAGPAHRRLAAHRGRGRARGAARQAASNCCRPRRRAASSCARSPRAPATRSCAPTSSTCATCGATSGAPAASCGAQPPQLLYQDLSLAQRVLRDMVSDDTAAVRVDSRENYQKLARLRRDLHAERCARSSSTTPASGRCSTSTTSSRRSRRRWRAAST